MITHKPQNFIYPDYISPLPADEFIKAAVKKQEMYDAGLAQVQQTVDGYAQMRNLMLTDEEKKYFDDNMTAMVKEINNNAGLDFSFKQNVSAVLGLGRQLENNPYILNAVSNGKEVQRRQQVLSSLDGSKRSAANDYMYMKDVQDYIAGGGLGKKLTTGKGYEEYYDLSKDWDEFMKSVKGTVSFDEFVSDPKNPAYIQKITTEGFSKEDIASRFQSYLASNPKALRQLQIDTGYNLDRLGKENAYAGYTDAMRKQAESASVQASNYAQMVSQLEAAYNKNQSPTVKSQLDQAKARLTYYENARVAANEEANKPYDQFDINEYSTMYMADMVNNMSNMYAGQKVKKDLITNEYWKEARADSRALATHNRAVELEKTKAALERRTTYDRMAKQAVVDLPNTQVMLKNVSMGNAIPNLQAIENLATQEGNSGAAGNLAAFIGNIGKATNQRGLEQIKTIRTAIKQIQSGASLNAKYKSAVAMALGFSVNPYDQEGYSRAMNQVRSELDNIEKLMKTEVDSRTPVSFNYGFDYTKGSFNDMNFILNADQISDQFAIGLNPETVTTSDDGMTQKTSVSTKYGQEPPKSTK
jgi:hypothetical protein